MKKIQFNLFIFLLILNYACNSVDLKQEVSSFKSPVGKWNLIKTSIFEQSDTADFDYKYRASADFKQRVTTSYLVFQQDSFYEEYFLSLKKTGSWYRIDSFNQLEINYLSPYFSKKEKTQIIIDSLINDTLYLTINSYWGNYKNWYIRNENEK